MAIIKRKGKTVKIRECKHQIIHELDTNKLSVKPKIMIDRLNNINQLLSEIDIMPIIAVDGEFVQGWMMDPVPEPHEINDKCTLENPNFRFFSPCSICQYLKTNQSL